MAADAREIRAVIRAEAYEQLVGRRDGRLRAVAGFVIFGLLLVTVVPRVDRWLIASNWPAFWLPFISLSSLWAAWRRRLQGDPLATQIAALVTSALALSAMFAGAALVSITFGPEPDVSPLTPIAERVARDLAGVPVWLVILVALVLVVRTYRATKREEIVLRDTRRARDARG